MNEMQNDVELFLYYLSAHLAAAISVIEVMKYEFNSPKQQEYSDWFDPEFVKLQSNGFQELNCLRIAVVHLGGNLAKKVKKHTGESITMRSGNITIFTSNTSNIIEMPSFDKIDFTLVWQFNCNTVPVVQTCQFFMNQSQTVVEDCEKRFYLLHDK